MDYNLYFGHISGVENRVSFQNNVRYSEVVAKSGSDGRDVPKIHTKSGAARAAPAAPLPPALLVLYIRIIIKLGID